MQLYIDDIKRILPHRYPFLLVDRVCEVEFNNKITGYKNLTANEEFFNGHFPEYPIMPGVLIIEALAQISAIMTLGEGIFSEDKDEKSDNVEDSDKETDLEKKPKIGFLAALEGVKFKKQVRPGDRLDLHSELVKSRGNMYICDVKATVDDKVACVARLTFAVSK